MFFLGDGEKTRKLTCKVDSFRMQSFIEALNILGVSSQEAFEAFLPRLIGMAMDPDGLHVPRNVTFELDEEQYQWIARAKERLGLESDGEIFDLFLGKLTQEANRIKMNTPKNRLSPAAIESRIQNWANKPKSYPHLLLKAYFLAVEHVPCPRVPKGSLYHEFNRLLEVEDEEGKTFNSLLHQMCSDAARAYGNVFVYDRKTQTVTLNPLYEKQVLLLKDSFLPTPQFGFFNE